MRRQWMAIPALAITLPALLLSGTRAEDTIRVPLSQAANAQSRYSRARPLRFNQDGMAEIEFPAGVHRPVKYEDGAILIDRNGDGKLDETDQPTLKRGDTFELPFEINGQPRSYNFSLPYVNERAAYLTGNTLLEGTYDDKPLRVLDINANGVFGDSGDLLQLADSFPIPAKGIAALGDAIATIAVADNGSYLEIMPYDGKTSTLTVLTGSNLTANLVVSLTGQPFMSQPQSGSTVVILPGTYALRSCRLTETGTNQPPTMLYGRAGESTPPLALEASTNALKVGPPFELTVDAFRTDDGTACSVKDVSLVGCAGEVYRAHLYGANSASALEYFLRLGDQDTDVVKLSYG